MSTLAFSIIVAASSLIAGFLGALTGLGGGVVIVPVLTLGLGVDIRYAIGASLVSVIATSSGAASAYVRDGLSNIRVAMLLEIATTLGALAGAAAAAVLSTPIIAVTFGVVLLYSALQAVRAGEAQDRGPSSPDALAVRLRLDGTYPSSGGERRYHVQRVPAGFALMGVAGVVSGLLGVGSGAIKVLAMDRAMRLPFKVSSTTSNFMIGVTAAASVGVYLRRGYIDPGLAAPVVLGVLAGSLLGARILVRARTRNLRWVFAAIIALLGVEMIVSAARGHV